MMLKYKRGPQFHRCWRGWKESSPILFHSKFVGLYIKMLILQNIYFSCYMWGHKMKNQKYHTVRTVPKNITLSEQFQKISHCQNSSKKYHTVRTVPKNITLSEQFQKISHCQNSSKNITLSEQFQKISHCQNSSKKS
jgi:thioester reductase-like protein